MGTHWLDHSALESVSKAEAVLQSALGPGHDGTIDEMVEAILEEKRLLEETIETARRIESEATRANDAKTVFLRMASHELRTPLQALHLQLTRLERRGDQNPENQKVLAGMKRSLRRMSELCDGIQTYTRIESDRLDVEIEDIDARKLVSDVIDDVRLQVHGSPIAIELLAPDAPSRFRSDVSLVKLVVSNLVMNAVKFASKGPVRVEVGRAPIGLRIAVSDDGPGIPERDRVRIFEGLANGSERKGEASLGGELPGVGLGLTLVREIVRALGGSIGLQSSAGQGSRFTVILPTAAEAERVVENAS